MASIPIIDLTTQRTRGVKRSHVEQHLSDPVVVEDILPSSSPRAPKKPRVAKDPAEQAKKRAWDVWVAENQWEVDKRYEHKEKSPKMKKTKAIEYVKKCTPKLTERELSTLPFQTEANWRDVRYKSGHIYIKKDIIALVERKAGALGVPVHCPPLRQRRSRKVAEQTDESNVPNAP